MIGTSACSCFGDGRGKQFIKEKSNCIEIREYEFMKSEWRISD